MKYYVIIKSIADCLKLLDIPCRLCECHDGWQLRFPWTKGDVAMHSYTIGAGKDFVETYKFPWDCGDVSSLSPENAAIKIIRYYYKLKEVRG